MESSAISRPWRFGKQTTKIHYFNLEYTEGATEVQQHQSGTIVYQTIMRLLYRFAIGKYQLSGLRLNYPDDDRGIGIIYVKT
jgi:hypothetical protein